MTKKLGEMADLTGESARRPDRAKEAPSAAAAFRAEVEVRRYPRRTAADWRDFWDFVEFHSLGDELDGDGYFEDLYDWCCEHWQPGWQVNGYNPKAMW